MHSINKIHQILTILTPTFILTSKTELCLSWQWLPDIIGFPSTYKHFLPSQVIKKTPESHKRMVACCLDIL